MTDDIEFETYLIIGTGDIYICLFDIKNKKNLYEEKLIFQKEYSKLDIDILSKFLEENIFKIEKLIGKFIKNIFIILDKKETLYINLCMKKKNYQEKVILKHVKNSLTEAKDIFKESYKDYKIMHMLITNFLINGNYHLKFNEKLDANELGLELQFISIRKQFSLKIDDLLKNYQIKIVQYLDRDFIENSFSDKKFTFPEMIYRILRGYNDNEVKVISKNPRKLGFFEKFFQLFS